MAISTITSASTTGVITSGTAVPYTSATNAGTTIDFTGIPSWVKRITILFNGVSLSSTGSLLVQLGNSGGYLTSGYDSSSTSGGTSDATSTAGFVARLGSAALVASGIMTIAQVSSTVYVAGHTLARGTAVVGAGTATISGTIDRVRITSTGADTFDAGSINILYE